MAARQLTSPACFCVRPYIGDFLANWLCKDATGLSRQYTPQTPERRVFPMRIENIRAIKGPNVFSHQPVLVMRLDLENLAGKESYEIPGFIDRLLVALPGIRQHVCGKGYAGGF